MSGENSMTGQVVRETAGRLFFKRGYGETGERVSMASLGLDHPERVSYTASPWWILRWLLPEADVGASDVFVEFGCGKGRVVLDAARRYRFRRVVGVELAPDLSDVARQLLEGDDGNLRCRDVRIETTDATAFEIPDDMTYAYFYNPFNGAIFEEVCANIAASLQRSPRFLRVIYLNPVEHDALMATGCFEQVRRVHTTRFGRERAAIYEAV
jgi:SAM-dependent methyltransferase